MSAHCAICPMKWELLKAQLAMQFTLYNDDGADFWEVVLKSRHTSSQKAAHCTHRKLRTTSQKSAHHSIHPIHSWWSWLLRSCSHYTPNFSKVIALHTQLLKSQLTTQFTLYIHDGADFWEVALKSHVTAHTANWEQLLQSHRTAHTTSQKSAHYAVYPVQSQWSWLLRSRSQKSSHCTHRKLRTTSQQSAHYTICTATWEHLKSRLAIVTHMWNYA